MSVDIDIMHDCPCGTETEIGDPSKFGDCCFDDVKAGKKVIRTYTRKDLIAGPYKNCPSCKKPGAFGVLTLVSGNNFYIRECVACQFQERTVLPELQKRVVYLDQFVVSELAKLLDTANPKSLKIIRGPHGEFWIRLFALVEKALKSQLIICPDSFYHRDESAVGTIDFQIMKRLYEHFSGGKTLYPSFEVERLQIQEHFSNWLRGKKTEFVFDPQNIAFGRDLHSWQVGLQITVGGSIHAEELRNLREVNVLTEEHLQKMWEEWRGVGSNFEFEDAVRKEVLAFGGGTIQSAQAFFQRRDDAMQRMLVDPSLEFDMDDVIPPPASNLIDTLMVTATRHGISRENLAQVVGSYLRDARVLLEIPALRISSVMFANLARCASMGEKKPPKSTADVKFISSYLPYCDAMFVDKQSARLLKQMPKNAPPHLRLEEFDTKIFSLNEKEDFLNYLEGVLGDMPPEQAEVLIDMSGDEYAKPYWSIVDHERISGLK